MASWIDEEFNESKFPDERLGTRLRKIVKQLFEKMGNTIPMACQDWASTKAAYRFFSNSRLSEEEILSGHFQSTKLRVESVEGTILVLHDTTEITYKRSQPSDIGYTRKCANRKGLFDQDMKRAMCGVLMHSSLALTPEGLPLGFSAKKFWNRDNFKDAKSLYRKKNATRIPVEEKESFRWLEGIRNSNRLLGEPYRLVHIGDREADMYDLFSLAQAEDSNYLIRIKVNRRTALSDRGRKDKPKTINDLLRAAKRRGKYKISYRDADGANITAILEIKFERMTIKPSFGIKSKKYPDLEVVVIHAKEVSKSGGGRQPIDWKLITNLPINSVEDAVEKLHWYALRWKIEVFFKILKSGCKVEESKLRTAEALCKLIAIYSVLSWRVFWMTMLNRESTALSPRLALSEIETKILDHLRPDKRPTQKTLSSYIQKIARLGGYLARSSDPPPGNKVIWRGLQKLTDIQIGVEIGRKLVGN